MLINSCGGRCKPIEYFYRAAQHIQTNGGSVETYATTHCKSAAAEIFNCTDDKFSLPWSYVMWHDGIYKGEKPPTRLMRKRMVEHNRQCRELLMEMLGGANDILPATVYAKVLADESEWRNQFAMEGEEMHDFEMLRNMFKSIAEMKAAIESSLGCSVEDLPWGRNPAERCLQESEIEQEVLLKFGCRIKLIGDEHPMKYEPVEPKRNRLAQKHAVAISNYLSSRFGRDVEMNTRIAV